MEASVDEMTWEQEIAQMLNYLSDVQTDVLEVLQAKQQALAKADLSGMTALQSRETELVERLQHCQERRTELLQRADDEGLPSDSLQSVARSLPGEEAATMATKMREAGHRSRLLQHHSITNFLLAQRTMLHLAQMLEILATGGAEQPTYGKGQSTSSGALMDQAI